MLRDEFINNSVAGVWTGNFNALGMFVWYSLFQNNYTGLSNNAPQGAGAFSAYNSIFEGSTGADIYIGNTGTFTFRNNYSIGSTRFCQCGGSFSPGNITIQGNSVLDTVQRQAIR